MAYYVDLTPCDYFRRWQEVLIAVGWLEPGHSFATGKVSKKFWDQLVGLLKDPWQPAVAAGFHRCGLCQITGERNTTAAGAANLFVPARGGVYVAPSLIVHYIEAHEYCPPADFQGAVLSCPEMKSLTYLKEMKARGLSVD